MHIGVQAPVRPGCNLGGPGYEQHLAAAQLRCMFSVFLVDSWNRLLLRRRRSGSGGTWHCTCEGEVTSAEAPARAADRQVRDELGIGPFGLAEAGTAIFADPGAGIEPGHTHLFTGIALGHFPPESANGFQYSFIPLRRVAGIFHLQPLAAGVSPAWRVASPLLAGQSANHHNAAAQLGQLI